MSVMSPAENDKYRIAKLEQDFFRSAIGYCMSGDTDNLDKVIKEFLSSNNTISAQELFAGFQTEGRTLIHIAANSGHSSVLNLVLQYCTTPAQFVNLSDERGFTPLINATISESNENMTTLIKLGADVNKRNKDGAAAIHFAAGDGSVSRMTLLFEAGADLSAHSRFGGSPIHWAAGKGQSAAIAFLVSHGVDVNSVSTDGVPPVIMAAVAACDEGVKSLVEAGADVGVLVSGNLTVLHICAEHGLLAGVTSIVSTPTGLNCVNIETVDGNKPIHLAAMSNHVEIISTLLPLTTGLAEASIDSVVEDGKVRLAAWNDKYNPKHSADVTPSDAVNHSALEHTLVTPEQEANAEKYKEVGNALYKKAAYSDAIKAYNSAIALNKSNPTYYSNRSACYLTMKDAANALTDAETCRRLKPDWAKGCYRLAAARLALEQYEDAAVAAFEGCKLDDKNEELKALLKLAVKKGQEAHQKTLAAAKK